MELEEQDRVLENDKKNMLVSASAGSGKTYVMIKYITSLICDKHVPIENLLVLTFTKAAATQMKDKLLQRLKEQPTSDFVTAQIDALPSANISTIHSFCEKFLKKYANLLNLSENFAIIEENMSQKLKERAFEKALKKLEETAYDTYVLLTSSFKNDKRKIKDIILEIEKLSVAVADKEQFLQDNLTKAEEFFDRACDYLFSHAMKILQDGLDEIEKVHVDKFHDKLKEVLNEVLQSKNLIEFSEGLQEFTFPRMPLRKSVGDEIVDKLQSIKDNMMGIINKIKNLNLSDTIESQKSGELENALLKFFILFESEQDEIKRMQNCLDFNDLEKYMNILSSKENLFDGLEYVFVDEYQDTNKIQERIIKKVAQNCNFVAVGDLKQGIYGFRLASAQIFMKDMEEFEADENSAVNYLKSNFRSSQKVLDFVNDVFKVCMTEKDAGVNYEKTSMLEGKSEFAEESSKAVNIDLVDEDEEETVVLPEVYSVKEANLSTDSRGENLLAVIKKRLLEVLSSEISCDGKLRPCRFSDIAILSRKRDALYNKLESFLQESGIPVISNSRSNLMEEPEMLSLLNYLKIALSLDDEIACLSVLLSGLERMNLDDIIEAKGEESICEAVRKNPLFGGFRQRLRDFSLDVQVVGLRKAFEDLILKTQYRAYLNLKNRSLNTFVDKFLDELDAFGCDLPAAINYFETVDIAVTPEISVVEDSVLLTTVHNSKGLEYPIVFLIGCDQSVTKAHPKASVEINERFGLAVKFYDEENNSELTTARMLAIQESEKEKDFIEELMIFYVALTRAKNRLYLFGNYKESMLKKHSLRACDTYFDFIFYALKDARESLQTGDCYETENMEIVHQGKVEEDEKVISPKKPEGEISQELVEQIEKYLDFEYAFDDNLNFRLKESVTSLNNKNKDEVLTKYSNESFNFGSNMIEVGNAYHAALKAIDFEGIENLSDLRVQLQMKQKLFDVALIDENILLNNILILKKLTAGGKVFKEKEFMMKGKVCDFLDSDVQDEILVQGVIDLFVVKNGEVILVDYKYTNHEENLVDRYKEQLKLYKMALKNSLKLEINQVYLLSLKSNKLIKVENI